MNTPTRDSGKTYEHTYLGWIEWFRELALSSECQHVTVPRCWHPFIYLMGHVPHAGPDWFPEDYIAAFPRYRIGLIRQYSVVRRQAEIAAACRPELVHALYLWDTVWRKQCPRFLPNLSDPEFLVTCNSSFFRPEVMQFLEILDNWCPDRLFSRRPVVLCPCAADKPYPAPLHSAIKAAVPNAYLMIVTGVFGIVPEDLWARMPVYDSGLPNFERVLTRVEAHFRNFPDAHEKVVVYLDHYAHWVWRAVNPVPCYYPTFVFPFGHEPMNDGYLPLMSEKCIGALKEACEGCQ